MVFERQKIAVNLSTTVTLLHTLSRLSSLYTQATMFYVFVRGKPKELCNNSVPNRRTESRTDRKQH